MKLRKGTIFLDVVGLILGASLIGGAAGIMKISKKIKRHSIINKEASAPNVNYPGVSLEEINDVMEENDKTTIRDAYEIALKRKFGDHLIKTEKQII